MAYKSPGTIYHTDSRNEKRERGGEPDQPVRAEQVKALPDMMLLIRFNHGEVRLFDAAIPEGPAFEPLHDEQILASPAIDHGAVPWKDRETYCAPFLRFRQDRAGEAKKKKDRPGNVVQIRMTLPPGQPLLLMCPVFTFSVYPDNPYIP